MEILIATRNRKKVREIRRILQGLDVGLHTLEEFPDCPDVEETGETFEENAALKAMAVAAFSGMHALADDSGLVVDALGGAPGVRSARYAGVDASDRENVEKLLGELEGTPGGQRTARFVCVIALADPRGGLVSFEGTVEGRIGTEPLGESGFGYDPVFYPLGHERTFAQMGPTEKDGMSHRGRALEKLRLYLAGLPI